MTNVNVKFDDEDADVMLSGHATFRKPVFNDVSVNHFKSSNVILLQSDNFSKTCNSLANCLMQIRTK